MKLEDVPKKQPFQLPDEAHFDSISSKVYAQIEKEEQSQNLSELDKEKKSIFIDSQKTKKTKKTKNSNFSAFWVKPQFMGIAATLLLLLVAIVGIYTYSSKSDINPQTTLTMENNKNQQLDFSQIPTQQINDFLLDEDISENELVSFMPQNSSLETNSIFEESDLNSIDAESLDLMLEEEYL
jgi:hypothetical protein